MLLLLLLHVISFVCWQAQQQREHEDDMRARLRRSESIEKAAVSDCRACDFDSCWSCVKQQIILLSSLPRWVFSDTFVELFLTFLHLQEAAALVSQRSMNPREFFRQLSSSSSQSPTSPGSSRGGTATPAHGNNYLEEMIFFYVFFKFICCFVCRQTVQALPAQPDRHSLHLLQSGRGQAAFPTQLTPGLPLLPDSALSHFPCHISPSQPRLPACHFPTKAQSPRVSAYVPFTSEPSGISPT